MVRSALASILLLLTAGCGDAPVVALDSTRPHEVALAWLHAYLEGDGSHTQYEFESVPDVYRRDSETLLRMPTEGAIERIEYSHSMTGSRIGGDPESEAQLRPFDLIKKKSDASGQKGPESEYVRIQMGKKLVRLRRAPLGGISVTSKGIQGYKVLLRVTMQDGTHHNVVVVLRPTHSFDRHVATNDQTTWRVLPPGPKGLNR